MDAKGRALDLDNNWIERFWKSIKYDYIYLNPAEYGLEFFAGILSHISYYNSKTHHSTKESPNNRYLEKTKKAAK